MLQSETANCPKCGDGVRTYNGSCLGCGAVLTKPEPAAVAEPAPAAELLRFVSKGQRPLTVGKIALAVFLGNLMTGVLAGLIYLALK